MEFVHSLCLYPGARQVNKAKKEGRTWEWVTGKAFRASTWGEREEGRARRVFPLTSAYVPSGMRNFESFSEEELVTGFWGVLYPPSPLVGKPLYFQK